MKIELHSCAIEISSMSFPLGTLCIKTVLNEFGKVILIENLLSQSPKEEAIKTYNRNPSIVGVSIYLWNSEWFDNFYYELKKLSPNIIVFGGGTEITANPKYREPYDFLVFGEGETPTKNAIKQVLNGETPNGPGIITRGNDLLLPNIGESLETLESPFLTNDCRKHFKNNYGILWEMARGCPFKCAFCFESRGSGSVRYFPEERLKKELDFFINHGIKNIFVLDPTFNINKDRCIRILDFLVNNAPGEMHFSFELRAELLTKEIASCFGKLNCALQIGLQTTNQNALKNINRSFNREIFSRNIGYISKWGTAFGIDLIIGLPGDNLKAFKESLNYVVSLSPSNIDIFKLAILPGTELYDRVDELNINYLKTPPYTIINCPGFSSSDIEKALVLKDACDLFYTKGQACMWINLLCRSLSITPSECFLRFYSWMKENNKNDEDDIFQLQDEFVTNEFKKANMMNLLPAIKSFMELHQAIAYLYETGEMPLINLSYSPDELRFLDSISLSSFVEKYPKKEISLELTLDEDGNLIFV